MDRDETYEELDARLTESSRILASCTKLIRELDLNSRENVRRIGEAIGRIVEIRMGVYEFRPDLEPDFFKKGWNDTPDEP